MNPFDKYQFETFTLKGDISILSSTHEPNEFPHREEQISKMADSLSSLLMGLKSTHMILYGKTGTGKTSVTRYVTTKLAEKIPNKVNICYINCQNYDSPYSIMVNIARSVLGPERIPQMGWTLDRIYEDLIQGLKECKRELIIILDEVDKLVMKNGGDSLYLLLKITDESLGISGSIIGITNDTSFYEKLDPRVRSRLNKESIVFPPYNSEQLRDILLPRVKEVLPDEYYDESAVNLCAAIGAQEHGDARKAIDLMRVAIELAIKDSAKKVTNDYVYKARDNLEIDILRETIKTLPTHSKIVLLSVILCSEVHPNSATTGEVSTIYNRLCKEVGITPLTQRRISDYLSDLEDFGLISTTLKSLGRYGRTRLIRITGRENDMKRYALEDSDLKILGNITQIRQSKLDEKIKIN
ncbi:Cdc6/Cdc18 family protein [Cuniculiplasma sp. SKW3]|uniref:Cdc6/Cdc18 family protein n=1 Tax=unclassified Cuniculiplasma TaxID=2619706 RepID=UPI003FD06257